MFRQTHSVRLETHIRLLQLHGTTIGIPPLTILTTTLSQARSEAMEVHLRVLNRHNATAPTFQLEDLKNMVLVYRHTLLHGTKVRLLIDQCQYLSHYSGAPGMAVQIGIGKPPIGTLHRRLH